MRVIAWGVSSVFIPLLLAQSPPDSAAILRRVSETYANAKQYLFAVKKSGEEAGVLEIAVRKPDRFRFHADGRVIDGADAFGNVTLIGNGGTAWNYLAELQQYTKKKTTLPLLDTEPPEITPETFVLQADTVFLTRYAELARAVDHARLLRQETIPTAAGAADCYVFELRAPLPGFRDTYTWWVDKTRFVILREDTLPATPRRPVSSVVYTVSSIDQPLSDDLFHFEPPPGAKLVDRFEQ